MSGQHDFGYGFTGYLRDELPATPVHPGTRVTRTARHERYLIAPRARAALPRREMSARYRAILWGAAIAVVLIGLAVAWMTSIPADAHAPSLSSVPAGAVPDVYAWTVEDGRGYRTTDCERVTGQCRDTFLPSEDAVVAWIGRLGAEFTVQYLSTAPRSVTGGYIAHGVYSALVTSNDGTAAYLAQSADDDAAIDAALDMATAPCQRWTVRVLWQA